MFEYHSKNVTLSSKPKEADDSPPPPVQNLTSQAPAISSLEQINYAEDWAKLRLSTEPVSITEAEDGVRNFYATIGFAEPRIIWCGCPLTARLLQSFLIMHQIICPSNLRYEVDKLIYSLEPRENSHRRELLGDIDFKLIQLNAAIRIHPSFYLTWEDKLFAQAWNTMRKFFGASAPNADWEALSNETRADLRNEAAWTIHHEILQGDFFAEDYGFLPLESNLAQSVAARAELQPLQQIASSAGWTIPLKEVCLICERPSQIKFDENDQLHSDQGPAVEFSDGLKMYLWHGLSVPKRLIEDPEDITIEEIEKETNIEIRRVMVERYGASRYLENCGACEIQRDEFGVLYRKEKSDEEATIDILKYDKDATNDIPLIFVKVVNATPENNGTRREYFLRVPPTVTSAREAVAWTFDLAADEYDPAIET